MSDYIPFENFLRASAKLKENTIDKSLELQLLSGNAHFMRNIFNTLGTIQDIKQVSDSEVLILEDNGIIKHVDVHKSILIGFFGSIVDDVKIESLQISNNKKYVLTYYFENENSIINFYNLQTKKLLNSILLPYEITQILPYQNDNFVFIVNTKSNSQIISLNLDKSMETLYKSGSNLSNLFIVNNEEIVFIEHNSNFFLKSERYIIYKLKNKKMVADYTDHEIKSINHLQYNNGNYMFVQNNEQLIFLDSNLRFKSKRKFYQEIENIGFIENTDYFFFKFYNENKFVIYNTKSLNHEKTLHLHFSPKNILIKYLKDNNFEYLYFNSDEYHLFQNHTSIQYKRKYKITNQDFGLDNGLISWNDGIRKYSFYLNRLHRYDPQDITINSNINFAKPISYGKKQIKEVGEIWKRSKNILQFFMNLRNLKNSVAFYDKYNIVIQEDKKTIGLYLKTILMYELIGHEEDIISIDIDDTTLISADSSGIVKLWDLNNLIEKIIYPTLNLTFVNNTDWVIWNNNYQYVSSAKGGNILGFFENGKQYRASKFHNLDTFKKTLFNKDEIMKLLPKL